MDFCPTAITKMDFNKSLFASCFQTRTSILAVLTYPGPITRKSTGTVLTLWSGPLTSTSLLFQHINETIHEKINIRWISYQISSFPREDIKPKEKPHNKIKKDIDRGNIRTVKSGRLCNKHKRIHVNKHLYIYDYDFEQQKAQSLSSVENPNQRTRVRWSRGSIRSGFEKGSLVGVDLMDREQVGRVFTFQAILVNGI